jgi:aldehyde:ferredoxin oxidoreductase
MVGGWAGRILRVDLSRRAYWEEPTERYAERYRGEDTYGTQERLLKKLRERVRVLWIGLAGERLRTM